MATNRNMIIGERVRFYRLSKGITMEGLLEAIGSDLPFQSLSRYEKGTGRWPADLLIDIAIFLKVDIRKLTGMDGEDIAEDEERIAETYKTRILDMAPKARTLIYKIIDGIRSF